MQLGVLRSDAEGFVGMPCIHDAFDIPLWSLWDLMGIWGPSVCSGSGDLLGCLCFNTWADRIPYTARCLSQPRLHWPGGDWKPWRHTHWLSQSVADELWWIAWQQAQEKVQSVDIDQLRKPRKW